MTYKEKLKQILTQFNLLKDTLKKKIDEISLSQKYSEEYKIELIKQAKEQIKDTQEQLTNEALKVIEEAKNKILGEKTNANKDQGFDLKLNNTLKILEMIGHDLDIETLNSLVHPFRDDYYTMKVLRTLFIAKGMTKGINEIFGNNTIDSRIQSLDELSRIISHSFFGDIENTDTLKVTIALNYISDKKCTII
ncbi:hypothetical protein PMX22_11690 [Clostridium butyricum]|uniref:hypothetical protein n=1 Tax=Clostridium butyricum TaxID=1492 RepID=UPI00232EA5E0|nr:hypothetical protein [Clostridium butyricum]MDB2160468.1 hypothetical protein [Clostridium butyricum]